MRLLGLIFFLSPAVLMAAPVLHNCDGDTNAAILSCNKSRYEASDKALNSIYKKVISTASAQQKEEIIKTQRAWVQFKERHCKYIYQSILPGAEAGIEEQICLWKTTENRSGELAKLQGRVVSDGFYDFLNAMQGIGYSRAEIIDKLVNRYKDDNHGWKSYSTQNCATLTKLTGEDQSSCLARMNSQRGSY